MPIQRGSPTALAAAGPRPVNGARNPRLAVLAVWAVALVALSAVPVPAGAAGPQPLAVAGVDLSFDVSGLLLSDNDPETDSTVWVNGTVVNAGDTPADATALFYLGDGQGSSPFFSADFTVANESTAGVAAPLATRDLVGYQTVTVRLAGIVPAENGTAADNEASVRFKVHLPGEIDLTTSWDIDQRVNTTGFVTLRGTASIVVHGAGSLWVSQQAAGQFEILLLDDASLHLDGGLVTSNEPITVVLRDRATLTISNGGTLVASVSSASSGPITVTDGNLRGARLQVDGGSAVLTRANVSVGSAWVNSSTLDVRQSRLALATGMEVSGPALANFDESQVVASAEFSSVPEADSAFPGFAAALGTGYGRFFPAVHLTGPSFATFTATVVEGSIRVGSSVVRSEIPIHAHMGARAEVNRIALVEAADPNGVPVANASIVVREASANATIAASVVAANGTARIPLLTDIVAYNTSLPVGSYQVTVSRGAVVAPVVNLTFPQLPDLSPGALEIRVPVALEIFEPWDIYSSYQTFGASSSQPTQVWNTSAVFRGSANFSGVDVFLQQSFPFELFVAFDTSSGLNMTGSTLRSEHPFNLYLLNGTSAVVRASALLNANLLMSGGGSLELTDSRLVGSLLGQASQIVATRSFVWAPRIDVDVNRLAGTDAVLAGSTRIDVEAADLELTRAGLTGTYEPFDPETAPIPTWVDFNGLAGSSNAALSASPAIALNAGSVDATTLTVWTEGEFSLGATSASTVSATRLVVSSASVGVAGGVLRLEDVWVSPEAALTLVGGGVMQLRALVSSSWARAPSLTVHVFDPILVEVTDAVGLPVDGALVVATPILSGAANESASTDSSGIAVLYLHRSSETPAGPAAGSTYRVVASRAGSSSPATTWDPSSGDRITLSIGAVFAQPEADAIFAIIYRGTTTQLIASPLQPSGALALLAQCGIQTGPLSPPGTVFPLESVQICLSGDLVYRQGGQSQRQPMAAGVWVVEWNGTVLGNGTLDASGFSNGSFLLPAGAGNFTLDLTVSSPETAAPYVAHPFVAVSQPPKLVLSAFLLKAKLDQREPIRVSGRVTFENGTPAAGATIAFSTEGGTIPASVAADARGSFFVQGITGTANGSYSVVVTATTARASPSDPSTFNYTVGFISQAPTTPTTGRGLDLLTVVLSGVLFAACTGVFLYARLQRRVARGEYAECGNCGQPTYAADKRCRNCNIEFEPDLAKCSHCGTTIAPDASSCPQCGTAFTKAVQQAPFEGKLPTTSPPTVAGPEFTVPAGGVPSSARRAGGGRLEELEFKLPGTTETVDLGEASGTPSFATPAPSRGTSGGVPGAGPAPSWAQAPGPAVERMGLPARDEVDSPLREIGPGGPGERGGKEPVSLGTTRPDLAAPTRPSDAPSPSGPTGAGGEEVTPAVLRELLRQAAPELSDELLPGDIKKELDEIARGEAPAAAERQQAGPSRAPTAPSKRPEDQTMEAPEKSRKSAFDVFSTPTKTIPAGYERRGPGGKPDSKGAGKAAAAPVCPNCGGNWVVQRDGKNSCRVCGTRW